MIRRLTTVGRAIDLSYPTNRAIAIVTGVVMVGGTLSQLLSEGGWGQSLVSGANAGLSVFLTWALCRELDPDHAVSAFVAVGLALIGLLGPAAPGRGILVDPGRARRQSKHRAARGHTRLTRHPWTGDLALA